MSELEGSAPVAVVTGAARGLGAAVAEGLAAEGWRLVLIDRCADDPSLDYALATADDLAAVVARCGGDDGNAVGAMVDVRHQRALDGAIADGVARFGGLDAAVAAAGAIAGGPPLWETDDDLWDVMVGINLEGVWRLARAAVPHLLARPEPRRGRFVAVSSAGGTLGLPQLAAYSAAKHGANGLVRSLSAELGPHGITANAVAPGSMDTGMLAATAAVYGITDPAEFAVHHRLPRLLEATEVAALVVWLCSPAASGITGAVLAADAGMTGS